MILVFVFALVSTLPYTILKIIDKNHYYRSLSVVIRKFRVGSIHWINKIIAPAMRIPSKQVNRKQQTSESVSDVLATFVPPFLR